jgi:peptidoglycan/xylan/chitin deacetylase (PgdA/CDA1 family)
MYHRVSATPDYLGLTVPPARFAEQLATLGRHARVLPLRDLVRRLADPAPLEGDVAAITFDDGYRDNLDEALPVLETHGMPATVFVTVGFVDGTVQPMGERLRRACEAAWRARVATAAWAGTTLADDAIRAMLARAGSLAAVRTVRRHLKGLPDAGERVVAAIEALAGGAVPAPRLMLDWSGVRALAARGVEIGSHAVSHGILARMDVATAAQEIAGSKRRLEHELGCPVDGFAFPNGQRGDYTPEHVADLRAAGYAYACTAETGANVPGSDPFRLRRIGVGSDDAALLALKLALGRAA